MLRLGESVPVKGVSEQWARTHALPSKISRNQCPCAWEHQNTPVSSCNADPSLPWNGKQLEGTAAFS